MEGDSGNVLPGLFRPGGPMPGVPRKDKAKDEHKEFCSAAGEFCSAAGEFWPVVLATVPPRVMTMEEAYRKVPHGRMLHIEATHPRSEDGPPAKSKHAR